MSDQAFKDQRTYHHVMPLKLYFGVFAALVMLTGVTVLVSYADLGKFAIYTAMIVALVKGGFVVGYFMHLKFDTKFHQLIFFGSLFFMSIFFVFTFIDMSSRAMIVPEQGNFALSRDLATQAAMAARVRRAKRRAALAAELKKGASAEALEAGKAVYTRRCVSCHGPDGKGHGVAAAAMDPKPRDYTDAGWQRRVSHEDIARVILRGGIGTGLATTMPPHPDLRGRIVGLVAYVRSFAGIEMKMAAPPKPVAPAAASPVPGAAAKPVAAAKPAAAKPAAAKPAPAKPAAAKPAPVAKPAAAVKLAPPTPAKP